MWTLRKFSKIALAENAGAISRTQNQNALYRTWRSRFFNDPREILVFERVRRSPQDHIEHGPPWELQEQGKLGQQVSASEITEMCIEENILMPGLSPDKNTESEGKKQLGRILKKMFEDENEFVLEGYKAERDLVAEENFAGNRQYIYRYRFTRADQNTSKAQ